MTDGLTPTATGNPKPVWIAAAAVAGLVLFAGLGAYGIVRLINEDPVSTDKTRVSELVKEFATAVDREDQSAILALLCAAEAEEVKRDDDFDPSQAPPVSPPPVRPVTVANIQVSGDAASARVTRPGQQDATLHFRKENDAWKVCARAGDPAQPTATATTRPAGP